MSTKPTSAGLLLHRDGPAGPEVLLVHPGGPLWAKKDLGAWSIPKGELGPGEDPLACARRELAEELGTGVEGTGAEGTGAEGTGAEGTGPEGARIEGGPVALAPVRQRGGKTVLAWAVRGDFDPAALRSNTFEMEWPPRSGKRTTFPEVDRAAWFPLDEARRRINAGQAPLLDQLEALLASR